MTNQSKEKFKIYKNVFDEFTLNTLFKLSSQGHFDDLIQPVKIGKEANIFLSETREDYVIVKIYRLASCNFNKMYYYIKSDPRFMDIKNKRRIVIFKWVQREYKNLLTAREVINVPKPIAFSNNVIVMESIGNNMPAQQLKDNYPKKKDYFCKKVLEFVEKLANVNLVHGDLSEFNILNLNDEPYFIDFSQSTSLDDPNGFEYLKRDLENLKKFFEKLNFSFDLEKIFEKIKEKHKKRLFKK
ncbi:MAG: serine protein kinase RIO [Candidatus Woesearchaeota archaeon]